ncbi:hypothetical protein AYO44_06900 [Planctomycetaceae bacterium SCGC AG-212-F19]|nr:hypothetical protein AYO44_06900 [Planctomycetaceae bacterium SCGC AG-212-F19]
MTRARSATLGISGPLFGATFFMAAANFDFKIGDNDATAAIILFAWLLGCLAWFVGIFFCSKSRLRSFVAWALLGAIAGPVLASLFGVVVGAWTQESPNLTGMGSSKSSIPQAVAGTAFVCVVFLGWIVAVPGLICGIIAAVWMRKKSSS